MAPKCISLVLIQYHLNAVFWQSVGKMTAAAFLMRKAIGYHDTDNDNARRFPERLKNLPVFLVVSFLTDSSCHTTLCTQ